LSKIEEAIYYFDSVLEIEPNHVDALSSKGRALVKMDRIEEGIDYFYKVLMINPSYIDDLGIPNYNRILEIDTDNVDALISKGKAFVNFDDKVDEAIYYFDSVLEIEPNHVDALSSKGRALVKIDRIEEGIDYFDRVLKINPNHVDALYGKGEVFVKIDEIDKALAYFDRVALIDPNHVDALYGIASMLDHKDNFSESLSYLDRVLKIQPQFSPALIKFQNVSKEIDYYSGDALVEQKIYDSEGHLVAYLKSSKLWIQDHEITRNFIDEWDATIETRNGQEYEVLQHEEKRTVIADNIYGGRYGVPYSHNTDERVWKIFGFYWMYPVQKGDEITTTYTLFRPVE